jgi:hypothetical protein
VLTALAHLRRGEQLSVQWVLGQPLAPERPALPEVSHFQRVFLTSVVCTMKSC